MAAYNSIACEGGSPFNNRSCGAVVRAISDKIVETVARATGGDDSRSIVQTFERDVALYITGKYRNESYDQKVAFLYEMNGQPLRTDQADLYLGYYPERCPGVNPETHQSVAQARSPMGDAAAGSRAERPGRALGSPSCAWCANGTSPGGWADVMAVLSAGVEYAAPSLADLVTPVGSLIVASDWAKWVAGNFTGRVGIIGWVRALQREGRTFHLSTNCAQPSQ